MDVSIVIGANYGDEGKGVITDALASRRPESIVVLTNGGAQRGHTVVSPFTGKPHTFHHFGSGTFRGCSTYFPETFILNPMQFVQEYRELLDEFGVGNVRTTRHRNCYFTTPFDMILNQDIERWRQDGGAPYGTCGMGIWETLVRNRFTEFSAFGSIDLFRCAPIEKRVECLRKIRDEYCPRRYRQVTGQEWNPADYVTSDGLIDHFIQDVDFLCQTCPEEAKDYETLAKQDASIIFENGQGLLLDDEYAGKDKSIYSTPSRTGMRIVKGILAILEQNYGKLANAVDAYYVSRPYMTRHGPGAIKNSTIGYLYSIFGYEDNTNFTNEFQGEFRQAPISQSCQIETIKQDLKNYMRPIRATRKTATLAYTHLDQQSPEKILFPDIAECGTPNGADAIKGLKW